MGSPSLAPPGAYALPFARRRPHLDGSLVRELRAELGQSSSPFPRIDSYGPNLDVYARRQPTRVVWRFRSLQNKKRPKSFTKGRENFACETIYFACELDNFACERILFRQVPRKLLKSLSHEMYDFAV
jgi:hypothetical protein